MRPCLSLVMLWWFMPNFHEIFVFYSKNLVNQMCLREILDSSRDFSCDALAIDVVFGHTGGCCTSVQLLTLREFQTEHALLQLTLSRPSTDQIIDGMFPFVCQACQQALYERQVQFLRTQTQKEGALPHMTSLHGPAGM